jgi:hypothetical protein
MYDDELRQVGEQLIEATRDHPKAVEIDPLIAPLVDGLGDDDQDEFWDSLWGRATEIVLFERFHDASPMTNSTASAIELLDLGAGRVLLTSPGDISVDMPMLAFASAEPGDWETISELVGDIYRLSVTDGHPPAAVTLADRIHVTQHLDLSPLRKAVEAAIRADLVDHDDMVGIIERHSGTALDPARAEDPAALADDYLLAVVRSGSPG